MKYALFLVEVPETTWREDIPFCRNFANRFLEDAVNPKQVTVMNPVSFLLDLSCGLHDLGSLVALAKDKGLHSHTLFFDQEPSWVIS